ncbi:hypothetical protein HIM_02051 [Hirsutella minnesotensis 3608]|nr:hypothetical protein HIM_02051 [Hirsutella minnesotensis 3608]
MHSNIFFTLALATLLTLVAATGIQKRSFAVERVANPSFTGRNGPRALAKVYRKFSMPMPRDLEDALEIQTLQRRGLTFDQAVRRQRIVRRAEEAAGPKGDFMGSIGGRVSLAGAMNMREVQVERRSPGLLDNIFGKKKKGRAAKGKKAQRAGGAGEATRGSAGEATRGNAGEATRGNAGEATRGNAGENARAGNRGGNTEGGTRAGNRGGNAEGGTRAGTGAGAAAGGAGLGAAAGGAAGAGAGRLNGGGQQAGPGLAGNQSGGGMAQNQAGVVAANPEPNDTEYLSPIEIGGQKVNVDFDTGSSDLWVFTKQLKPESIGNHRVYDPTQSQMFQEVPNAQFKIKYGDGSGAQGSVGMDVVSVGGVQAMQPVELATAVSAQFVQDQNNDGLMGLAFSKLNTVKPQKQMTFFDNVKSSLQEPVFSADLRKNASGSYTFGTIDRSKFKGDLTWVPINDTMGFWQFSSEKFAVADGQPQPATPGGQAIADTGTTLILADAKIVEGYYNGVQGAQNNRQMGGVTVPCNAQLPDLMLDVGGAYMARVAGSDINFAPVGDGTCFGGLQAAPPGTMGIYGDIFFKSQFVVFNGGNNTLGIAPHA